MSKLARNKNPTYLSPRPAPNIEATERLWRALALQSRLPHTHLLRKSITPGLIESLRLASFMDYLNNNQQLAFPTLDELVYRLGFNNIQDLFDALNTSDTLWNRFPRRIKRYLAPALDLRFSQLQQPADKILALITKLFDPSIRTEMTNYIRWFRYQKYIRTCLTPRKKVTLASTLSALCFSNKTDCISELSNNLQLKRLLRANYSAINKKTLSDYLLQTLCPEPDISRQLKSIYKIKKILLTNYLSRTEKGVIVSTRHLEAIQNWIIKIEALRIEVIKSHTSTIHRLITTILDLTEHANVLINHQTFNDLCLALGDMSNIRQKAIQEAYAIVRPSEKHSQNCTNDTAHTPHKSYGRGR